MPIYERHNLFSSCSPHTNKTTPIFVVGRFFSVLLLNLGKGVLIYLPAILCNAYKMKELPKIPLALCPVPKEEDECDVEDDGNRRRP